ncbi:MAG: zinc-dependent peptidase [Bacteroidia bacterium]
MDFFSNDSRHQQVSNVLEKYNLYFRNLSKKGKLKFVKRVLSFEREMAVIGKGIAITDDMRLILYSYITQLTFGLKDYFLSGYDYINVYPDSFSLKNNNEFSDGVTYNNKIIGISWKKFSEGHLFVADGENLFFYQLGMALVQTVKNGASFDQHFGSYLDNWFDIFSKEYKGKSNVLNIIGNENEVDYVFAKLVEMFFEKPMLFQEEMPNAYAHFCLLLNQNPLQIDNDYRYKSFFFNTENLIYKLPDKVKKTYRYNSSHWSYYLPIFTAIILFIFRFHVMEHIVINWTEIISIVLVVSIFTSVILYKKIQEKSIYFNLLEFWIINLLGFVPICFLLIVTAGLWINFNPQASIHKIENIDINEIRVRKKGIQIESFTFYFKDNFLYDYPMARTIDIEENKMFQNVQLPAQMKLTICKGIAGFDIIKNKEVITNEHTGY